MYEFLVVKKAKKTLLNLIWFVFLIFLRGYVETYIFFFLTVTVEAELYSSIILKFKDFLAWIFL